MVPTVRLLVRHKLKIVALVAVLFVVLHLQGNKLLRRAATVQSIRDYTAFFDDLEAYKPVTGSLKDKYTQGKAAELFAGDSKFLFLKSYLENVLDVSEDSVADLKQSHTGYVDIQMKKLIDEYGVRTFGNILPSDREWSKYQGSAGYVLVGGGKYSWLSYLVIKQIRASGARYPIELFLASKADYEADFCEKILPKYNARCNVFDDKLSAELADRFNLGGYQYKMLALMSSRFENVLYVDSDNFPTQNVDYLFQSDLYRKNGLLLWPDAWARTTNPKFFEIARKEIPEVKVRYSNYDREQAKNKGEKLKPLSEFSFKDLHFHDFDGTMANPSSETGMFLINKTTHLRTLLLALYYNVYGPLYYYPLFTQGSAGEGDKETFIAAALVMNEPYFQTPRPFKWTGYISETDSLFKSKALGHYDPERSKDGSLGDRTPIVFMHLSYPKYYPSWLVDNHDLIYEELGNHIRMYADVNENVGYDFDLRVLQFFTQALCPNYYDERTGFALDSANVKSDEYMGPYLEYVRSDEETNRRRCKDVFIPHLTWLKETTDFPGEHP